MKTTLNLDEALPRDAKKAAADRGTTLTHLVEEALRETLTEPVTGEPFTLRLVTERGTRPPAVDIADRDALNDFLDGRT